MSDPKRRELDEAIDACRPFSDDLDQPEFAELADRIESDAETRRLFGRSQAFDAAVAHAMQQDVDVPAGLAGRVLAALECDQPRMPSMFDDIVPPASVPGQSDSPSVDANHAGISRRTWLVGLASAGSTAAAVSIGTWLYLCRALSTEEVVKWATEWSEAKIDQDSWRPFSAELKGYPLPTLMPVLPHAWQMISTELSWQTAAYNLSSNRPAYLFVARTWRDCKLPINPPKNPQISTGPWRVAVWRDNRVGCVYALAFKGPQSRYRHLIHSAARLA